VLSAWALVTAVAVGLIAHGGVAAAQGLGDFVGASECFSSAPPSATVYRVVAPGFGVGLLCGDRTQGVFHIDERHPIAEDGSDDENIRRCMFNIFTRSDRYEIPADDPYVGVQIRRPTGGTATAIYNPSNGRVVTMYTSDGLGNNWAACAAYAS
jgi:hypothetical protein